MSESPKFIVVIGASAGGVNASREVISQLNADMDAAFFIVLHLSGKAISDLLLHRLQGYTNLTCKIAEHKVPIVKGTLYIAPSDKHMLVKKDHILIGEGPF